MKTLLLAMIRAYHFLLSPLLGGRCRFSPSCSQYLRQCLEQHPLHRALYYGLRRIAKCHPFHPGGKDLPPGQN